MSLLQTLEYQQIARVVTDSSYLEADPELRAIILKRAKEVAEFGTESGFIKLTQTVAYLERLRQEREMAAASQTTTSIRLSSQPKLDHVHALLDAMRQPQAATDATLPQMASIPPAQPQQEGDKPAQSQ